MANPKLDIVQAIKNSQGEGSKSRNMNSLEVIKESVGNSLPPGLTFDVFIKKLATLLKNPNNKLVQFGNTVFLLQRINPETVEFHTFSVETPKNLVKNLIGGAKLLKNNGYKKAITYGDSPGYVELAKKTGFPVKVGQGQKVVNGKAVPVYTFELEL